MKLPLFEDAPPVLRITLGAYLISFAVAAISSDTPDHLLSACGFFGAGLLGGFYGALLFTNYQGCTDYMSAWAQRWGNFGLRQPSFFRDPAQLRYVGALFLIAFPAIFLVIGTEILSSG